jgi:hypothetical protein
VPELNAAPDVPNMVSVAIHSLFTPLDTPVVTESVPPEQLTEPDPAHGIGVGEASPPAGTILARAVVA